MLPTSAHNNLKSALRWAFSGGVLLLILLCAPGCKRSDNLHYSPQSDPSADGHLSIAFLKSYCLAESQVVTRGYYIEGLITANDLYGEYPHGVVIEDKSGGIEVGVGGGELFRHYPIGRMLRIYCEGLALADYGGKVILGAPPTGEYLTDRIEGHEREEHLRLLDDPATSPTPLPFEICDARHEVVGRYVELRRVRVVEAEAGVCWCERDSLGEPITTTRHLVDRAGDTLDIYLPATVSYATEQIPSGELHCSGILDYFNRRYQLRLVNRGYNAMSNEQ